MAGSISVTSGGGATVDGDGTHRVIIRGSITDINAALNGMIFTPPGQEGTVSLTVNTKDATEPAPLSDSDAFTITVTAAVPRVRLAVADTDNHRVLLWNAFPRGASVGDPEGAQPDLVLGQSGFTSAAANRGSTPSLATLNRPTSVASDGTRLAVADSGNNRVLIWLAWPANSGQAADVVLGQPNGSSVVAKRRHSAPPGPPIHVG